MKEFQKIIILLLGLFVSAACSENDSSLPEQGDEVVVRLSAGASAPLSRAAFDADTPVSVYVYQRTDAGVPDFSVPPYKVATGVTSSSAGALSNIILNEGNVSAGKLTVAAGHTYDFVLAVNPPDNTTASYGGLSGITHGRDLLAGRAGGIAVTELMSEVDVQFNQGGADAEGNLPHLCSGVSIGVSATDEFIATAAPGLRMSIVSAEFKRLINSATLGFSASPMVLNVTGSRTGHYVMDAGTSPVQITNSTQTVSYDKGILLPFPLLAATTYNVVDIDFHIGVNDADVLMAAESVQLPEFKAGYRYQFTVAMKTNAKGNSIDLYLTIAPWDSASWTSGMGGDDTDRLVVRVGSWDSASWTSSMGGDNTEKMTLTVRGWSTINWNSYMGGTNEDGTNK